MLNNNKNILMKKSTIPNIYKPNYIEDKHITKIVNQYIIDKDQRLYGKISVGKEGIEKWRAKNKEDKLLDQTRLFEVKQIFKKYQVDFEVKTNGFTKKYIDQFTNLLFIKDPKKYIPKRIQMLKEKELIYVNTLTDASTPMNYYDNNYTNTNKNPFYITSTPNINSLNKGRNKKILANNSAIGYKNIQTEINENRECVKQQPFIIDNDDDEDMGNSDEDILIDPQIDMTDIIAKNQRIMNTLNSEYKFHTEKSKQSKYRRMINDSKDKQSIKKIYLPSVVNIGDRSAMSPVKKHFLHIIRMRKSREKEDKLQNSERIPRKYIQLNPIKISGSSTKR